MKKYYQYLGLALIMVFSFYYTEKIATVVLNKSPLMQEINNEKANYEVGYVNAIINEEYIEPGINGKRVDSKESFYNMKASNVFNSLYLVYEQVKPNVSLSDNKDKIIRQGNHLVKKVSLIVPQSGNLTKYLDQENIKYDCLVTMKTYQAQSSAEVINNEKERFNQLESALNLNKDNKHLCLVNEDNKQNCLKNKNYLIEATYEVNNNNLVNVKREINNGDIILIAPDLEVANLQYLLREIKFKDLNLVFLSELISEQNND